MTYNDSSLKEVDDCTIPEEIVLDLLDGEIEKVVEDDLRTDELAIPLSIMYP